jgi:hypothetical protein
MLIPACGQTPSNAGITLLAVRHGGARVSNGNAEVSRRAIGLVVALNP